MIMHSTVWTNITSVNDYGPWYKPNKINWFPQHVCTSNSTLILLTRDCASSVNLIYTCDCTSFYNDIPKLALYFFYNCICNLKLIYLDKFNIQLVRIWRTQINTNTNTNINSWKGTVCNGSCSILKGDRALCLCQGICNV